jgi:hypothetical protein
MPTPKKAAFYTTYTITPENNQNYRICFMLIGILF